MTFTYNGDPSVSDLAQTRFLLQDTVSTSALFTDEELTFLIAKCGSPVQAARTAAETIAARYSGQVTETKKVGDLSLTKSYSDAAASYSKLAASLARMAARLSPPTPVASLTEPSFAVGMHDNGSRPQVAEVTPKPDTIGYEGL